MKHRVGYKMKKIYIIANSPITANFNKEIIKKDDITILFNIPIRQDINPDLIFVANTIHPAKKFYRSSYITKLPNTSKIIFPYSDTTIQNFKPLEKISKFTDIIRGWSSNGGKKIIKKLKCAYEYVSFEDYNNLTQILNINSEIYIPSTGAIAINYALNKFDSAEYEIILVGFTFEGSPCHMFQHESNWITKLSNIYYIPS